MVLQFTRRDRVLQFEASVGLWEEAAAAVQVRGAEVGKWQARHWRQRVLQFQATLIAVGGSCGGQDEQEACQLPLISNT